MIKTIDECFFQIQNGANIKQGDVDGGFPITRIETTANDKFNRDRMGYAGITDISKYESYVLEDGDLLMSHINSVQYLGRTVLYVKQPDETIIHGMNLLRLKARRDVINPAYARYCFYGRPFRSQVGNITKKSVNQASFAVKDLKQIKIEVPSLSEQEQIVDILDKLQKLIEMRNTELSALDDLIKARFVEMFGDPVQNTKGWDTDTCKNLTSKIGSGATPKGGRESYGTEGISLIRSMNVYNNRFEYKDLAYITGEQADKLSNVTIEKNDVLLNITGASVARCCVVPKELIPARVNQHVAIVRCKDRLLPEFLCNMFTENSYQRLLSSIATSGGATREAITKQQIEDLVLIVPPIELQQQFVEFYKQVDKSKSAVQKALEQTNILFESLMQKYFG